MRSSSASTARCETTLRHAAFDRALRWSIWAVCSGVLFHPSSFRLLAFGSPTSHLRPPPPALSRTVTFRTDDGATLSATWYGPSNRTGPVVILVHMLHRTRRDWDALATRLAAEGIGALAFDLRGHGESTGSIPAEGQLTAFQQDVAAARR